MKKPKPVFTVLAIDGGGVRGVIPARILQEIEARTGRPIADLFDMVGGTSTGAVIGGCLLAPDAKNPARPRFSAKEVLGFYHRLSGKIFPEIRFKALRKLSGGALYDPKPLEDALEESFGDLKVEDALTSFSIPVTDIENFRPVWIDHVKGVPDTSLERWSTMRLRDAARAAANDERVRQVLGTAGSPILYLDAPEFQRYVDADAAKMADVVKAVGKLE